ncbi:PepSY domain-containing protein [Shewanella corallii]|uniref:PepSY domain-containing protein n=1 Tax=Shewanella corallii TaxID=560080 RepID=A0ABT0NAG1_9GAMM|nr:PepSY-associated TM helix domain-containing protein [Shewanella corallii]MCL2915404.1 PepSY domain-containing protein [Shewanella corallii]
MKESFFRTMTWLHTWTGLLVCWLLMLIFFAGTLSYYRYEINLWMKPELHTNVLQQYQDLDLAQTLVQGQTYLADTAPGAKTWMLRLPTHRLPFVGYAWMDAPKEGERRGKFHEHIVTTEGEMISDVRATKGGHFFYRLHFDLHYLPVPLARYLVGFATMFMLLAIITGIVIHKRIFKDFFALRLKKGPRSWLDSHTLSSVLALPYHLMITYTGLITLMFMYMPSAMEATYDGNRKALQKEITPVSTPAKPSGTPGELVSLSTILPSVLEQAEGKPIRDIRIQNPLDANSQIQVVLRNDSRVADHEYQLLYQGTSGEFIGKVGDSPSSMGKAYDTMIGLHAGRFAEPTLRFALFLSGVLGCVMIASGTLLWSKKLRQKQQKQIDQGARPSLGLYITESLNLGVIAGLPIAAASYLWANRLLSADYAGRYDAEINLFFTGLGVTLLLAFLGRINWRGALLTGGLMWLGIPVLNALTSSENLITNIVKGQWFIAWIDLLALMVGGLMLLAASYCKRKIDNKVGNKHKTKVQDAPTTNSVKAAESAQAIKEHV